MQKSGAFAVFPGEKDAEMEDAGRHLTEAGGGALL